MMMTRETNVAVSPSGRPMDLVTMTNGQGFQTIPGNWEEITNINPGCAARGERLFLAPSRNTGVR